MKYLIVFILLSLPAIASDTGKYRACAGKQCREFMMTIYTQQEIKKMDYNILCDTGKLILLVDKEEPRLFPKGHYAVDDHCRKMHNMSDGMAWNFVKPKMTERGAK